MSDRTRGEEDEIRKIGMEGQGRRQGRRGRSVRYFESVSPIPFIHCYFLGTYFPTEKFLILSTPSMPKYCFATGGLLSFPFLVAAFSLLIIYQHRSSVCVYAYLSQQHKMIVFYLHSVCLFFVCLFFVFVFVFVVVVVCCLVVCLFGSV